ncbi:MAG: hypothetical protein ACTSUE_00210 [Promethearchaeota archaeon]
MRKKIRIIVKAYPEPSKKYGSSICTAGLVDDREWIRIYPIDLNYYLKHKATFKKWTLIEADVKPRKEKLNRKESHKVNENSIVLVDNSLAGGSLIQKDWDRRNKILLKKLSPSMAHLEEAKQEKSISIGLIKPRAFKFHLRDDIENIEVEEAKNLQSTLFGERLITPDKIPKKFAYKFYCQDQGCNCNVKKRPHDMICEDFELLESFRQWRKRYKDFKILETKLIEKYDDFMKEKRELYFVVGTTHLFGTWVIIGLYYPPKEGKQKGNLLNHLS